MDDKPRSSTTSKVAATGAGISIAAIIGIYSQVSPIIHAIKPDIAIKVDGVVDDIRKLQPTIDKITDQIKIIQDQQKKAEPKPQPPEPTPAPVPVIDERDKQIQELRDKIEQLIKPPAPVPVPQPVTDGLKILGADSKPVDGPIRAGQAVKVVASCAGDWKYLATSGTDSDITVYTYPDHCIVTLSNGASVALSHSSATSHAMILVKCQDAPRPPPVPDEIEKHSSKPRKLFIAVVEDVRNRSPETATTLSDLESWNTFRDKGHEWRFYDQSTQESRGVRAVQSAKTQTFDPPQIVIHDSAGEFVYAGVLPDMAGVRELVSKYGGV